MMVPRSLIRLCTILLLLCASATARAQAAAPTSNKKEAPATTRTGTQVLSDLLYVPGGNAEQTLDLYLPTHLHGPFPLIIWIHGGSWQYGSKADTVPVDFLPDGYAVASINYRLVPRHIFPSQIYDCKAAVRFLRANAAKYNLDPQRFCAWGYSAGGQLATLLGTSANVRNLEGKEGNARTSSTVQLVVDFSGPSDFLTMQSQSPPGDMLDHNAASSVESMYIGEALQLDPALTAAASPVTYIHSGEAPVLIMQGDQDQTVPYGQSLELQRLLHKGRVPVMLVPITGAGHVYDMTPLYPTVLGFLNGHFKAK